jgi:hypothetical protein
MWGWLYRRAVALKEFGERVRCRPLYLLGLWAREKVSRVRYFNF